MADKLHRVKVSAMTEDEEWKDVGTGHISSKYIDRLQGQCLLVHSESDGSLTVECKIQLNVPYQKQQDVIIWSEAENHRMAIQFENPAGCQEIWEDICQVQGKDPKVENSQNLLHDSGAFDKMPFEVPKCENTTVENIENTPISAFSTINLQEKLALMLENEEFIKNLLKLFHTCENQQDTEGLHYLYNIVKGILFLNKISVFKFMFSDECIMDVIGCLEYDPELDQPKRHREFLTQIVKFREVMPITHFGLKQKIHQTYRIQYIHDILLPSPSIFDENLLSDLKSLIFFNKIEIVTMLQEDEFFLSDVLAKLKDDTIDDDRRRELLCFFKEFCALSHTLESEKKDALLKILIDLGIMPILKVSIHMRNYQIKVAAIDIFRYLVEYSPHLVRVYALKEAQDCADDDHLLINIIIEQMLSDTDPEFSQAINFEGILHSLLDPENMLIRDNEFERSEFLTFLYVRCMNNLIAPLLSVTAQDDSEDDCILEHDRKKFCPDNYESAEILCLVLELLTFCVEHHRFYIKHFILSKNLLQRVLVLMRSKHSFLILGAVRFMRKIVGLENEHYNHYIIQRNLFEPVVKAFVHNGSRYNMLNSAIIELFEFIRKENIKTLVAHIVEKFLVAFETTEYVQTFKGLKILYETEKNSHANKCEKIDCRDIKVTEVQVKQEMCPERNIREAVIPSTCSDFLSHSDMFLQNKGEKENEGQVEHPERIASDVYRCSSSHCSGDANRTSRPHCSSKVALVDYPDDMDEDIADHRGGDRNVRDEDEDKASPNKRPKPSS